ncbi:MULTISPECIES: hypothetical protein [Pseudomonas]|jgi:hypothetical protein|uniref:Uncharacterized protein n=1 Tax=Pseudomonas mosselii TaxID=78327 RepID=A0A5R8ZGN9_9PSED|nr:hypothetical protein [Pseudomonas mosselii]TLP64943.1 hypothetical protein FEM01_01830 [Pseudomonas mosselii]
MSQTTHDQAMHNIYQQVLQRLLAHMNQAQRASLQLLAQRLLLIAGGSGQIGQFHILLLHGADKRSAHLLACLRAVQLSLAQRYNTTFHLRVLVARAPGLDSATLACHDRCFGALFLHDDPRVELLRADAGCVGRYSARAVAGSEQRDSARNAWLLFGHLSQAEPDVLLGARAYLELACVLDQAQSFGAGVDALVTVVPPRQRRRLMAWGRRCLRAVTEVSPGVLPHGVGVLAEGLMQLHGVLALAHQQPSRYLRPGAKAMQVVALDELLHHPGEWASLERMLGREGALPCEVQGPAGLFDPLALAHLQGLRSQFVEQRGYRRGCQAVLKRFARHAAQWPQGQALQDDAKERWLDAYGLGSEQLVCQAFAPFGAQGAGLERFVQRCHPHMRMALPYMHRALQGRPCPAPVSRWLVEVSGLEIGQLRTLYAQAMRPQVQHLVDLLARRDLALRMLPRGAPAARRARR